MKKQESNISYYESTITCITCSNSFISGSTKGKEVKVDTCSNCHPFYTGQQQFMQVTGRVERFRKQQEKQQEISKQEVNNKTKKSTLKKAEKEDKKMKEVSLEDLKDTLKK